MAMRFENVWPRAVVVYMQGLPIASHVDPAGLRNGWQQEPRQANDRDLKFFDAALATIRAKYKVQRGDAIELAGDVDEAARHRRVNDARQLLPGQPVGFGATRYPSTKGAPVMTVIHRGGHVYPPNASSWIVKFFNE